MWVNFTVRSVKPSVRWMERWESEGGRKDCKLGASRMLKARAGRWETLAEAGWYTDRLINTSACTEAYICTYAQGTMSTGRQVCTEMQTQTQWKRLATCVNNLSINHSMSGANQFWLSRRFMPFPSIHTQSPPAICISNKAAIHMHWLMISECY